LLAMVVNDNAGNLTPRGVLQLIASRLAPTEDGAHVAMPLKKVVGVTPGSFRNNGAFRENT
jgi:hypothetical protein